MRIAIPYKLRYVIKRSAFEKTGALSNMCFILDKHINDKDVSFLESELFNKVQKQLIEKYTEHGVYVSALLENLNIKSTSTWNISSDVEYIDVKENIK